jgi:aminopeptidase
MDLRTRKLAQMVVNYALKVKKDDNVIISGGIEAESFICELYKEVLLKGGHPILKVNFSELSSFFYKYAKEHQIDKFPDYFDYLVRNSSKYIGIVTEANTRELSDCSPEKIAKRQKIIKPISDYVVNSKPLMTRSTVGFPCISLAQEAEMSFNDYENFVYSSCLQDWEKVGKKIKKVLKTFRSGKKVHLLGRGVDLRFEVLGEKAMDDLEGENIPMGEVFMAPIRDSLNGFIKFEYPAIRNGKEVSDIFLRFEEGRVVESRASKNEDFLKEMLNVDENASYVGEFGIGLNPKINRFTKNLLFDEKIDGTIHLALGSAYKENGGGNDSAIHWDIVKDMREAKIILDGRVVCDNGVWKV